MALARRRGQKIIKVHIESIEKSRVQHAAYKRSVRKGVQRPTPGLQSHCVNCGLVWFLCLMSYQPLEVI